MIRSAISKFENSSRFTDSLAQLSATQDFKLQVLQPALDETKKGIIENVFDARLYLFLDFLLSRIGAFNDAIKVL